MTLAWIVGVACGCGDEARVTLRAQPDAAVAPAARCVRAEDCDDGDACTTDLCVVDNVCDHERVPGCAAPRRCARAADCDDGVACTRDRCLVSGVCDSLADDGLCAVGSRCDPRRGCEGALVDGGAFDAALAPDVAAADRAAPPTDRGMLDAASLDRVEPPDVAAADRVAPVDAAAPTDAGDDPRSGTYTLSPAVAYSCQDEVFEVPAHSLAVASVRLVARPEGVTVSWADGAVALRGPAIAGGSLRATGSVPHPDCALTLTLTASFPDSMRVSGELALGFVGIGCALTNCEARTLRFQGVRAR